jgi:hypothetical protein
MALLLAADASDLLADGLTSSGMAPILACGDGAVKAGALMVLS